MTTATRRVPKVALLTFWPLPEWVEIPPLIVTPCRNCGRVSEGGNWLLDRGEAECTSCFLRLPEGENE